MSAGLHKVKRCLQEFYEFSCACGKKKQSALSHATFIVRFRYSHAFLYLLHLNLFVYFHLMYCLTLQMAILREVPGNPKMCLQENLVDCTDCGGLATVCPTPEYSSPLSVCSNRIYMLYF